MGHSGKQTVRERMEAKLKAAFAPQFLPSSTNRTNMPDIAGHDGGAGHGGETHFRVQIVSPDFSGKSRIERHRAVNTLLAEKFAGGVHALALEIRAPGE